MGKRISLCAKLEALVGGYYLSGAGIPGRMVEILYHNHSLGEDDTIELIKENIVAYFLADERIAFVKDSMLQKLKQDTAEYDIPLIAVESFESEVLSKENIIRIADYLPAIIWIDDDFLNDEKIEFDFEAFDLINNGTRYLNPKHFSVEQLLAVINEVR